VIFLDSWVWLEYLLSSDRADAAESVIERAAEDGLRTVAIAPGSYGRSDALRNAAHRAVTMDD